ncbi:MAG: SipW-dependent-type signal peptide-containing protein [Longicatena sp.]
MANKKVFTKVILALGVICAGVTGATLALLSQVSETATNTFSSNKNISMQLREPAWDGYTFNDALPNKPGEIKKPGVIDNLGIDIANQYVPGDVINKNPMLKNMEENVWAAIKVEYINDEGMSISKADFNNFYGKTKYGQDAEINKNYSLLSNGNANYEVYLLNSILESTTETNQTVLFDSIKINENLQPDKDGKLPTFKIKVSGYAVQSQNVNIETAKKEILSMANQ